MDRRIFISNMSKGITASCLFPFLQSCNEKPLPAWRCVYNSTSLETIIGITELTKPLTILQISDSHISYDNESDKKFEIYSARMNKAYALVDHFKTGEKVTPLQCFKDLIESAKKEDVDLIALTGDIINYPSATAVEKIRSILEETNIPHIYVAGNHDWHYEGMSGSSDQLRLKWTMETLNPLYSGGILFSSLVLNGINIVTIDNSTYQINEEQLEFYKQQ
ncbi:MAG: metallophosphoesterase, partial [Proteiniphilum sp.]